MENIAIKEPKEVIEADKVGRPCLYSAHVEPRLEEVEQWIRDGITDYCIADNLSVGYSTWMKYKSEILELQEVYTRAHTKQVQKVVNSVFKRATGERVTIHKEKVLNSGEVVQYEEEQYIPGDVNAQKFYLVNRDPEHWQPENRIESGNITINNFNSDEWKDKRQQILSEIQKLEAIEVNMD